MSNGLIPSLETLPVEIIHHIFDRLDAQTILLSVRSTCQRLQTVVNNYHKVVLNFILISKPDFELICRLVDRRNVISLTLSHNDETLYQIEVFISRFNVEQFSQLRSLTLIGIEERHLKFLLKCVNTSSLISFSLKIGKADERLKNTTAKLLSSVIAQVNLRRLNLEIPWDRVERLTWPNQWMIQNLRMGDCKAFYPICTILHSSPLLQTLAISFSKSINYHIPLSYDLTTSARQLNSLTLENLSTKIEELELLLSLMPSLTHLKLTGTGNFLDGSRWEQFIQTNLPLLTKFAFFIQKPRDVGYTRTDVESIITSFRTLFWLEHKKWWVTCEYHINQPQLVKLYSIPICISSLIYHFESNKFSMSTYDANTDNKGSMMDNVKTIRLDFTRYALFDIQSKIEIMHCSLFRKAEELELEFNHIRLRDWTFFTSTLIDLTSIVQIKFTCPLIYEAEPVMLADIASLLQQTCNLSSLSLCSKFTYWQSSLTGEDICLMIPSHVRHLAVAIKTLDEINIILERLKQLSSAKFVFLDKSSSRRIVKWLKQKTNGSSYRIDTCTACVWLGNKNIQPETINVGNKRIKRSDDFHDF